MIISFRQWLEGAMPITYDIMSFVRLPWDWQGMQRAKIVNALYYYPKDSYVDGQPERNEDWQFSIITMPNLKSIPPNELTVKNIHSGNMPDQKQFLQMLKTQQTWYDDKINQVYDGIGMIGKIPEDFGGRDIRERKQ